MADERTADLLKKVFALLEDGNWIEADEACEEVLSTDPENAEAYLGKLMAETKTAKRELLGQCTEPFGNSPNYRKIMQLGDDTLKAEIGSYIKQLVSKDENNLETLYISACKIMNSATDENIFKAAEERFRAIGNYKNSAELAEKCALCAEAMHKDHILASAQGLMLINGVHNYKLALDMLTPISGWKIADELIDIAKKKIEEAENEIVEEKLKAEKAKKKTKKKLLIASASILLVVAIIVLSIKVIIPATQYSKIYESAVALEQNGKTAEAAMAYGKAISYKDAKQRSFALWDDIAQRETIVAGVHHIAALKADGTVVAAGHNYDLQCEVQEWKNIIAVSAGWLHTAGLKADGKVVATGNNHYKQCNVEKWDNIVAVSAGGFHTVGLKADGTVVATGKTGDSQCEVSDWENIIAVSAGGHHTVGLKADGTVVATGSNDYLQCNVSEWTDIVEIYSGENHTIGIKSDGTFVAVGHNHQHQCNVSDWSDIIAVTAGDSYTIGLKSDGTVVVAGKYAKNVDSWTDIVAIDASEQRVIGLKSDGTVVTVTNTSNRITDTSNFKNIKLPK